MNPKRLLILPRYTAKGPSSRVRMYQYLPYLKEAGFEYDIQPFFEDDYITRLFEGRSKHIPSILKAYFRRFISLLKASRYDVVWVQYELFPWVPFWLERLFLLGKIKIMVDYDDAVFHRYDQHSSAWVQFLLGKKIDRLMHFADMIIVGNEYLASHAKKAGAQRVEIIPSVVDTKRYSAIIHNGNNNKKVRVGWIGSPTTVKYLVTIENVIKTILGDELEFIVIGAEVPTALENYPVKSLKWSLEAEVEMIQNLDIGIMPLVADPFERGKCGYKLIQYMACGLPVVASPVGINQKLIKHGENGFLASNEKEWIEAINLLKNDPILRKEMGLKGREIVEEEYSFQVTAPKIINIIKQIQ